MPKRFDTEHHAVDKQLNDELGGSALAPGELKRSQLGLKKPAEKVRDCERETVALCTWFRWVMKQNRLSLSEGPSLHLTIYASSKRPQGHFNSVQVIAELLLIFAAHCQDVCGVTAYVLSIHVCHHPVCPLYSYIGSM